MFRLFSAFGGLLLIDEAFDDDAVLGSKIDEQTEFHTGGFEVVDELRAMLVGESRDGFEFKDDLVAANHIRDEGVAQLAALVGQWDLTLGVIWDVLERQLHLQTLLIDGFSETTAFFPIHFEQRVADTEGFVGVDKRRFHGGC